MTGWRNIVWALAAVVTLASTAFAQGGGASSTGSISGEVKDAQGGVLPGVTVIATSPAQIGQLTAVTNEAGIYRFPPCLQVNTGSPTSWRDSSRAFATACASLSARTRKSTWC
jgi:hypothetical protein